MLIDARTIEKLARARDDYGKLIFKPIGDVALEYWETREHLRVPPRDVEWKPVTKGMKWGGAWNNAWMRGRVTVPREAAGEKLFLHGLTGAPESLLFINNKPAGMFDGKNTTFYAGGNHHHALLGRDLKAGDSLEIVIEAYAGHPTVGCHPYEMTEEEARRPELFERAFDSVRLALRRDDVADFVFDLWTLLSLLEFLPEDGLRRGRVFAGMAEVYKIIDQLPQELPEEIWRPKLMEARRVMRPLLAAKNGTTAPFIGLIGHSHMDTAWHWTTAETVRKCARTYANALALMDEYPEFKFVQSSVVHADMMREHYPDIFAGIQQRVKEGRWEPNGAMWVEPDCNMSSGEAFVRQFLIGQRKTREWFDYTADTFWLPDTFGYSAAMPQLMRGCGVKYFCTTKLAWNDTNKFPYDTFVWHGLDGTEVIAHFTMIHLWPLPETLNKHWKEVQHKDVQDRRFLAYGFGDGGGGPQFEQIEIARRVGDLEGAPRTRTMTVSEYMRDLDAEIGAALPHWHGELYLEAHRGTLTSIAATKRLNRLVELALRDAEFVSVLAALGNSGFQYPREKFEKQWKVLLINQFHDILPGSSIPEVNDQTKAELTACLNEVNRMTASAARRIVSGNEESLTLINSLGWERRGELELSDVPKDLVPDGLVHQRVETVDGRQLLAIDGASIPTLGAGTLRLVKAAPKAVPSNAVFRLEGGELETPHAYVKFTKDGRIASLVDKQSGREVVAPGQSLNTFLIGQDVPHSWDNWDLDRDQESKMCEEARLVEREVVAHGPLQLRIRSRYQIGLRSTITQDVVFHASTPRIDFETIIDWDEKHTLLKASFPTTIMSDTARHEIQFGHVQRPTHRNRMTERAMFESCNHKWTDLSEGRFGVALLNDCKYGISVHRGTMALSLMKSGTHPDPRGDAGRHFMRYALLPHACAFSVESVVRPAYEFNVAPICVPGAHASRESLLSIDAPSIIVETVKLAEDTNSIIVRLYEAEGTAVPSTELTIGCDAKRLHEVNLLEEEIRAIPLKNGAVELAFRPFEIKSIRIEL